MASKKTEAEETVTAEVVEIVKTEPVFSVAKLRAHCVKLFGVTQSTFDGAMFGHSEDISIKGAKAIIDEWLYGKGGKK